MSSWGGSGWGDPVWGGDVYPTTAVSRPTVAISGVDRPYLRIGSSITWPKRGRKTAQFTLFDISQAYRPVIGEPVILTDGGTTFVGLIMKIQERRVDTDTGVLDYVEYVCECSDYAAIFDRRFVWRRYPAGSIAKNVIIDICRLKLLEDGFTTTYVDGFATIADELVFDGRSVTECFNQISDLTGEDWWVTGASGKDIYFKSLALAPDAPFSITDTSANWRKQSVTYDSRSYRNREYLRTGATLQTGASSETFTGNGVQWFFATEFVLNAAPTVTINGTPQTVYEMGVDPYPAAGWFWTRGGGGVQEGTQTPPALGASIVVQYGSYESSVVMAESTAQQSARAAIEAGSGVWESIDEARDVDNLSTAQALAAGILARHQDMPTEMQYETDVPGLEPGMGQPVLLAANGIARVPAAEMVTNGAFASSTGWTLFGAATITGGKLVIAGAGTATQTIGIQTGRTYRITYTISDYATGSAFVLLGGAAPTTVRSANGTYTEDVVAAAEGVDDLVIGAYALDAKLDNLSVTEMVPPTYYVTQVESRDVGAPFPGTTYYFRHHVTLSSMRDQGDWLTWWLNFYRQSQNNATSEAVDMLRFTLYDGTVI